MSAWYVFSTLGFYPVCPGSDQYVIGVPYAREMILNLENGNTFHITAKGPSARNVYIQSVKLNGKPYEKAYLTHADIMDGGELEFVMSSRPNKKRIFTKEQQPYSLTR